MNYMIIGGSGFVGRHLAAELLAGGHRVVIADCAAPQPPGAGVSGRLAFARVDVTDPASLRKLPIGEDDVVIHLAAKQYHGAVPRRNREGYF